MPRAAHDGGEDGPRSIVAREAGFAHAGAVVDNERSDIVIHGELPGHKRGPWSPRGHQAQPLPPCPLPARRGLGPPGGARPSSGDKGSPGRPRYYHKRQTLVRRRPHGRKPGLRPLPKRAQAPPSPRRRAAGARAGGDHTQQEARAGAPKPLRPRPFRTTAPPSPNPRWPCFKSQIRTRKFNLEEGEEEGLPPQRARAPIPSDRARKRSGLPAPTQPRRRARQPGKPNGQTGLDKDPRATKA